jgi:chondroitin AC lyase
MYGAAAVQVDLPAAPSLHAHKSWFFFDREYVALGAGISSTDSPAMNTTLNQTLHQGDILVDGNPLPAGEKMLSGVTWVLHDGIGYVFPQKTAVYVSSGTHTGNWGQINALQSNTPVTKDIFTLWMSSGSRPVNATYAYAVVPNIDSAALASYATKLPFRILANTTSIQAVRQMQLGISESIFYSPGQLTIRDGLTVSVDQPCMMLLEESPGHPAKLTVSTPRGPLEIHVKFVTGRDQKDVTIEVRGGAASGASHIQSVDLQ